MKLLPSAALCLLACTTFLPAQDKPGAGAPASAAAGDSRENSGAKETGNGDAKNAAGNGNVQPDPAKAIKKLEGSRYELNGIIFDQKTRAIRIPAKVNMTEGLLEYALVHESGKVHESLLSTAISPFDLNVVLLLLSYEPGTGFFDTSDQNAGAVPVKNPKLPAAAQLKATLEWKAPDGTDKTSRLESLLLNLDKKGTVTDGPFTYTGSMVTDDGTFMAKDTGSILALYVDVLAVINNPREGNENDDIWVPDKTKIPEKDTAVTLVLQANSGDSPADGAPPATGNGKGDSKKPAAKSSSKGKSGGKSAPKDSVKK